MASGSQGSVDYSSIAHVSRISKSDYPIDATQRCHAIYEVGVELTHRGPVYHCDNTSTLGVEKSGYPGLLSQGLAPRYHYAKTYCRTHKD